MNLGVSFLALLLTVSLTAGRSISKDNKDGKGKGIDLGFLIENPGNDEAEGEQSRHAKTDAFLQSRDFAQDLSRYFDVSISKAHIGVVTFGVEPYMAFDFNEHLDNHKVNDALIGLTRPSRGNKLSKALKFTSAQLFEGSARPDARKILVILASKGARGDAPKIADQLKKSGVTIYSVAVDSTKDGAILLNDVVSDPIKDHKFKTDSKNLKGLVTKIKDLILNPKPKGKSSVLERLENISNSSDEIKDAPEEHNGPNVMNWVKMSNDTQKDTETPQDVQKQIGTPKDSTNQATPSAPDTKDTPTTPEVPQDTPNTPDVPVEGPQSNIAPKDAPKVNEVSENVPKDPTNAPETPDAPEVSKVAPKIPEDVSKDTKTSEDTPKVQDAPNVPGNAQEAPGVPNVSEETEDPQDTSKVPVEVPENSGAQKDAPKVDKGSENVPTDPANAQGTPDATEVSPKVNEVSENAPKDPANNEPNEQDKPKDTPKDALDRLPDVQADLESTRTIKSAGHRPSPTAQVSNPTMSSDALPKFGKSLEPAKLPTPNDADPMKAEPVMSTSELPTRNEGKASGEKEITTEQPEKESSTQSLPDAPPPAPAPEPDMPKTEALATKASKQPKEKDNPTPEKSNEPIPDKPTESGPDSNTTPKESNSDNPDSEVPSPDNPEQETPNKGSPDSSAEETPKEKSPDSAMPDTPSPDNPEPKTSKESNKDKTAKEKPKEKKIKKSKAKSDKMKPGKSEKENPDMPMSALPIEELPDSLPPPDSPPPVKVKTVTKKVTSKKASPKDRTPDSPEETPETKEDSTAEENPDGPAPEEPNEPSPNESTLESPNEPSPDSQDQDKSKKSSSKKSSPKKLKSKKKVSKVKKMNKHGLIKLLAKTVKTKRPKMPRPVLVQSKETYESPAKRVSMPRAVNASIQDREGDGLEFELQKKLFGSDNEDERKSSDENEDENSDSDDDDSSPRHKHSQPATDVIGKQCKARVDIAFLLDGSEQVGKEHFHKSVEFVKKIIKSFTVSRDQTHISVAVCSERPHVLFDLKAFNDHSGMNTAMHSMSYPSGKLFTGGCLKTIRTGVFANSGRHDVPKILYFISGGKSRDNVDLPSRALRDMGVQVFSLGIGDKYNGVELKTMSTAPYDDHVMATKYKVLSLLRPYVSAQLCRGAGGKLVKPTVKPTALKVKKHVAKPTPSQKDVFDSGDSQIKAKVPKLEKKKSTTDSVKKTDLKKVIKAKRRALLKADIKKKLHLLLSNFTKSHSSEHAVYRSIIENVNGHQDPNCKDFHVLCKSWGAEGLCSKNSKYGIDFMSVQHVCPKTCSVCYS